MRSSCLPASNSSSQKISKEREVETEPENATPGTIDFSNSVDFAIVLEVESVEQKNGRVLNAKELILHVAKNTSLRKVSKDGPFEMKLKALETLSKLAERVTKTEENESLKIIRTGEVPNTQVYSIVAIGRMLSGDEVKTVAAAEFIVSRCREVSNFYEDSQKPFRHLVHFARLFADGTQIFDFSQYARDVEDVLQRAPQTRVEPRPRKARRGYEWMYRSFTDASYVIESCIRDQISTCVSPLICFDESQRGRDSGANWALYDRPS